jgi:hypothetical protein
MPMGFNNYGEVITWRTTHKQDNGVFLDHTMAKHQHDIRVP